MPDESRSDLRITHADALDGEVVLIELSDRTTLKVGLAELLSLNPERLSDDEEEAG